MSIWNLKEEENTNNKLNKDISTDVLIVGAGMTGMTLAYMLIPSKKDITIIDASIIGHGVTLNSTAKINYLQGNIYSKIKQARGEYYAKKYLNSQKYATDIIKDIIKKEDIECNLKKVPSFIFANTTKDIKDLKKEVEFLSQNNVPIKEYPLPSKITSYDSYKVDDTYIFNPIKYLIQLKEILNKNKIPLYENTKITKIDRLNDKYICYTDKYTIKTNHLVIASNYPFFIFPFLLPLKSYCEKSYIIVSRVEKDENFTCINNNSSTYSCRFYSDGESTYQISLSESHNIAFKQNDLYHFQRVEKIFNLKKEDIILKYSNIDIITPDSMPYIGEIKDKMYVACGFNTWGMTNSVLSAKIIRDNILNIDNEYKNIFSPKRITLAHIASLPYIIFSQIKSYLGPKILKRKPWYNKSITFYKENGIDYAIYIDENNLEHTIINKCPHIGCSLIFNEVEKTWDCPCHSSRFDLDGKCIKGPSNKDITPK